MTFYRSIILPALLQCCFFCCAAQDSNYVYQDTAILYQDSVIAAAKARSSAVENDSKENNEKYIADTVLRNNQVFVEADSIRALKNLKPFVYAKDLDSLLYAYQQSMKKDQESATEGISWIARFLLSPVTKYFFLTLAVVFVFFILYKLFFTEGFFQRSFAKINMATLPEQENLSHADYGKLIVQAIGNRNYRMAVRYHYLQTLQKLSEKAAIQFAPDKTNYEYIKELSGKKYKNAFASLTLNYEYVWYGEFEIDENIFNSIENKFKLFNSELQK